MKYILGKKVSMTQIFRDNGEVIPVTVVKAGPCVITQIKTIDNDGYDSVQIGFGFRKKINKPLKGHFKGLGQFEFVREFRDSGNNLKVGDVITVGTFEVGEKVKVTGTTKGKGFQGVVKRHNFAGAPASHGTKDQLRMPGSIGATGPAHVFKGQKMPGRMGGNRKTILNLEIVKVDIENNLLYIKGALPGARNSLVLISCPGEIKVNLKYKEEDSEVKGSDTKEKLEDKNEEVGDGDVKKESEDKQEDLKDEEKRKSKDNIVENSNRVIDEDKVEQDDNKSQKEK